MNDNAKLRVCTVAAGLSLLGLCARAEIPGPYESGIKNETSEAVRTPERVILRWPARSRALARSLIERYGEPASFSDDSLAWEKNGPWQKTVVFRVPPPVSEGDRDKDILEQTVAYDVPANKIGALRRFDGRIMVDKARGEMSSRAASERLNVLALNLADEVATGKRDPDDARAFARKMIKLSEAGKSSPYLEGLRFSPGHKAETPDVMKLRRD